MSDEQIIDHGATPEVEATPPATPAAAPEPPAATPGEEGAAPTAATPAAATQDDDERPPNLTPQEVKAWTRNRRELKEARQRADAAERDRTRLLDMIEQSVVKPAKEVATAEDPEPAQDQFTDPDVYQRAVFRWAARQEARSMLAEERKKDADARQKQEAAKLVNDYKDRVAAAQEKYPDFAETTEVPELPISQPMADVILRSDVGPDLYYYLGKHPAEAKRISELSPLLAARELGRLEAKVAAAPANGTAAPVSKAPAPIKPIPAGASVEALLAGGEEESMDAIAKRQLRQLGRLQ